MDNKAIEKFNSMMESIGDPLTHIGRRGNSPVLYTGYMPMHELRIPDGVIEIAQCFEVASNKRNKPAIEKIHIPNSCEIINYSAFSHCENLTGVIEANGVKVIHDYAFEWAKIEELIAPNLLVVKNRAFEKCEKLKNIKCSDRLWIGERAFSWCSGLERIQGRIFGSNTARPFSSCCDMKDISLSQLSDEEENEYIKKLGKMGVQYLGSKNYTEIVYSCQFIKRIDIGDMPSIESLGIRSYLKGAAVLEQFVGTKLTHLNLNHIIQTGIKEGHTHIVLGDIREIKVQCEDIHGFDIEFIKNTTVKFVDDINSHSIMTNVQVKAGEIMDERQIKKALQSSEE